MFCPTARETALNTHDNEETKFLREAVEELGVHARDPAARLEGKSSIVGNVRQMLVTNCFNAAVRQRVVGDQP